MLTDALNTSIENQGCRPTTAGSIYRSKSLDQYTSDELQRLRPLAQLSQENGEAKIKYDSSKTGTTINASDILSPAESRPSVPGDVPGTFDEVDRGRNSRSPAKQIEKTPDTKDKTFSGTAGKDFSAQPRNASRTTSSRNHHSSQRVSMDSDGKLHGHLRQLSARDNGLSNCQRSVVTSATRLRRRQSFSHTPSVGGLERSSRRVVAGNDGDVNAVVDSISRMKKRSPASKMSSEIKDEHNMTW
jgi:hypothetical protein